MLNKIKANLKYVGYVIGLLLAAVFFSLKRKNESLESELAQEKTSNAIKTNEAERQMAKSHADELVDEYEKLKGDDK